MKNAYLNEQQLLQNLDVFFKNIETQEEIASRMREYGYDSNEVNKGKALYQKVLGFYAASIKSSQEEKSSHKIFTEKMKQLTEVYTDDRKKLRVLFKDEDITLANLRMKGRVPRNNANFLDDVRVFYTTIQQSDVLRQQVIRMKIDETHLNEQLALLAGIEDAYADYTREKGESQQATKDRNIALRELEKWTRLFYNFAKIALKDKPLLLESLGRGFRK